MLTGPKSMEEVKGEEKVVKCPECASTDVVLNSDGERYCKKCGLVID